MRVRAVVAYDGTDYGGFQRQRNAPTIQAELESALREITGHPTRILAAGRTDAGVHAIGQVIAFDVAWRHGPEALQRALNARLPRSIAVREVAVASPTFHPRYDARRRAYRYTIYRDAVRHPLRERYALHVAKPLDLEAMREAAALLLGEHDFHAFGSPPQGEKSVRTLFRADWLEAESWLHFEIEANAFLYRMVRMIVGTLLRVGEGRLSAEAVAEILRARDRGRAGPAAPAKGLTLTAVFYDEGSSIRLISQGE